MFFLDFSFTERDEWKIGNRMIADGDIRKSFQRTRRVVTDPRMTQRLLIEFLWAAHGRFLEGDQQPLG
jgi:hypothetical protein